MSNILDVNIRCLKPKFMVIPFQAMECFFPDLQTAPKYVASPQQARLAIRIIHTQWLYNYSATFLSREVFTDFIQNKVLVAKVISV